MKISRRNTLRSAGALAAFLPLASACATGQSRTADPTSGDFVTVCVRRNDRQWRCQCHRSRERCNRSDRGQSSTNALAFSFRSGTRSATAGVDGRLAGVPTIRQLERPETKYGSRAFVGYTPEKMIHSRRGGGRSDPGQDDLAGDWSDRNRCW